MTTTTAPTKHRPDSASHLTDADVEAIAAELDAIRAEVTASLGESDAKYIRGVIAVQRTLDAAGRVTLLFGRRPLAWASGTAMLGLAKILENMEIGHNVIHGQWDWLKDPDIHSTTWEWDVVATSDGWKHTHNDIHHTWTNVVGKDDDVGYNLLRVSRKQPWNAKAAFNLPLNAILAPFFEWGIGFYALEVGEFVDGRKPKAKFLADVKDMAKKAGRQLFKDYATVPLAAQLVSRSGRQALAGTLTANVIRNLWTHAVIFCGHFPAGIETFDIETIDGETKGDWYIRQMAGSGNISGGKLMHIMTGNLSYQIEHHLFPDLPSNRYAEIAPRVQALCARYGLPYVVGPLPKQVASTWASIGRLSFPDEMADKLFGRPQVALSA